MKWAIKTSIELSTKERKDFTAPYAGPRAMFTCSLRAIECCVDRGTA